MTDTRTDEDLELYDDAKEEFPGKEDLNGRLVAIFVTGRQGQRRSEATGKMYDWVETVTVVLDDGPNDHYANSTKRLVLDGKGDNVPGTDECLVPSVNLYGPQVIDPLQWSAGGLVSRLQPRVAAKNHKPMRGRINVRKSTRKGMADPWSIAEPTDADREISMKPENAAKIREVMADIKKRLNEDIEDEGAFS